MSSSFEMFTKVIDEAVEIIEHADIVEKKDVSELHPENSMVDTQSLLARCETTCAEKSSNLKPTIRLIHHLACSGGTLISKCISAMPNVYLLSEAHPFSDLHLRTEKPKFLPSDISSLSRHANIPHQNELARKIFLESIKLTDQHLTNMGAYLVIRDHTHSDYTVGETECDYSAIVNVLQSDYNVSSLLTIRDPIDAYAALVKNKWLHFSPSTFDEYCRRFNVMLNHFEHANIVRFEDFVAQPATKMREVCEHLAIPYSDFFEDIFGVFRVTGDSGRSSDVIGRRDRIAPDDILKQCGNSKEYQKICDAGWYSAPTFDRELEPSST
jgi:Asp-tRNA(Asn)/Glu-tRNA(Gln) amidotransferase C subunit